MKAEKPPFESMDTTKSDYNQKLQETRDKCLPLLERLVAKFSEYRKISTALKEKRPPLEWLNKLDATCEKIQKKMTAQFFEKLDEAERKERNNTVSTLEEANIVLVSDRSEAESRINSQKRSRWDVKPEDDIQKDKNVVAGKYFQEKITVKTVPASVSRHTTEKELAVIDLTKNEDVEERFCRQKMPITRLKEVEGQDLDVEIIASTAGHNPLRRVRSQTQFVTLEEVNKSPFYKKFTSDNMILDSRAANLKYGTVFDLVKSKAQLSDPRNRKFSQRRSEGFSRRPAESKEPWSHRRDNENKKYQVDSFHKKTPLSHNQTQGTNLVNDKTYEHLKIAVKFFDRNNESNVSGNSWSKDGSFNTKYGKPGNEFQGKMPFYKQNVARVSRYSYPEKSFTTQPSKDPVTPSPPFYPVSNESYPANLSVTNAHFNSVGYPQQACSFHCTCCKNTSYFPSVGTSYQPTASCVVGNNNYGFIQYFPNQPVITPPNKNLPSPFPTFAVPPPSTAVLAASTPPYYSNANNPVYSVPVFCNEESTSTNKNTSTLMSWNTSNNHQQDPICRNIMENTSRPKDPRTDIIKERLTQSTSNIRENISSMDSALSKNRCISAISEEMFSQSCTFLRPDNLYRDFKYHSDEFGNSSLESLKSFGLINNLTTKSLSSKNNSLNKSDPKNFSNNEMTCKVNDSDSNNFTENPQNLQNVLQSVPQNDKQEGALNVQESKLQKIRDNYTSPLSNLYNDSKAKLEGYSNATNKQLENRKRKYDDVGSNSFNNESKRKNVGKVIPMTKFCYVQNEESLAPKTNSNSENVFTLKNHESSKCNRLENSPRSEDLNFSNESMGKIKTQTELVGKDGQSQFHRTIIRDKKPKTIESPRTGLLHSENILASQNDHSFGKEKFLETDPSLKKLKEEKHKSHDSRTNQSKFSKNIHLLEKQKPDGKDKQNRISFKKIDSTKMDQNCSPTDPLQPCENKKHLQNENLDFKVRAVENVSFSKIINKNPEPNSNSIVQQLPSENILDSIKEKSIEKDKLSENKIITNKLVCDKKKSISSQSHQSERSTEKEKCLRKNSSSNKTLISKKQDYNKIPPKEKHSKNKDKSSDNILLVISKNKDTCEVPQTVKTCSNKNRNSGKSTSAVSKNIDNNKTSLSRKCETSSDKNPSSSKKSTKISIKSSQSKIVSQQENLLTQEKGSNCNSVFKTRNTNTDILSISPGTTSKTKEKCPELKISSRKRNVGQIKDCSVVLKREQSVVTEKCTDKNQDSDKSGLESSTCNITSPKRVLSRDVKISPENNDDSNVPVSGNRNCMKKTLICHKKRSIEEETNSIENVSNCDNDKIKDLILRMKSLSQSEALKVIAEFASTFKVNESQQNVLVSKVQRVPSNGVETEKPMSQIKIKEEIENNYSETLTIEKNNINVNSVITDNTASVYTITKNENAPSQSVEQHSFKVCESYGNEIRGKSTNVDNNITEMKNGLNSSSSTVTEISSQETTTNIIPAITANNKQSEKLKFMKRKKLSELDKIHADLESFHGLDDIMKCSGFRTCRLKNESGVTYRESTIEDKQIKKKRLTLSPEESFFIEDEITIKMEPIPELTFDFIKQEPDYFE